MKRTPPKSIRPILDEVKQYLQEIYGDNLTRVILYGSYARGDNEPDSDIDILITLKSMGDLYNEIRKYIDYISELDIKYDTIISIMPVFEGDYLNQRTSLLYSANREGIAL